MDDIYMEDPRKYSAKQIKMKQMIASKKRTLGQYLFDVLIKSLICTVLLSINFTLFANAGNYNLFLYSLQPTVEVQYIYGAIAAISLLVMIICSLCRPLENIVLAICFAFFCLAIINQFSTFEKQSALLVAFYGLFSEQINNILYEHAFLIIGVASFLIFWIIMLLFKRVHKLIFLTVLLVLWGWLLSEAYFNSSIKYFRTTASSPVLRHEAADENLVFLSFKGLTSPNNLQKMDNNSKNVPALNTSFKNALGFFMNNGFTLYPNAMILSEKDPFLNILSAYNPNSKEDVTTHIQNAALRTGYFNFETLQFEKKYIKDSSLYNKLRRNGYNINVYQTENIDTCYTNNKIAVVSCKEKVSIPMSMGGNFSLIEKILLLCSQWLNSTGLISDINPILNMVKYVYDNPEIHSFDFQPNKLSAVNSLKALDQIADSMDHQNGKQAYFAIIDMPSETYVYDEYCQLKPMNLWSSAKSDYSKKTIDQRRSDYAEQLSCLYGSLGKFITQLQKMEMLDKTTIVIEGLNNPQGLSNFDNDFYSKIQNNQQVTLAIRKPSSPVAKIDYTICSVGEFLNSFFFTNRPCKDFSGVKIADKLSSAMKQQIIDGKYSENLVSNAKTAFDGWFKVWKAHNQMESSYIESAAHSQNTPTQKLTDDVNTANDSEQEKPIDEESTIEVENVYTSDAKETSHDENDVNQQEPQIDDSDQNTTEAETKTDVETASETKSQEEDYQIEEVKQPKAAENSQDTDKSEEHEVIPESIFDTATAINQAAEQDAIAKAKRSLAQQKQQKKAEEQKARQQDFQKHQEVSKPEPNNDLKDILIAPVAEGQKLSPEELKKQYHENLKKINSKNIKGEDLIIKVNEN